METERRPRLSLRKRLVFASVVALLGAVVAYGAWVVARSRPLYRHVKTRQRGWADGFTRLDAELGFAPIAGAIGSHVLPLGEPVPTRFDRNGFRIPLDAADDATQGPRPHVLALGCSFTYGDGCRAEEAYPFKVAQALGGTALNAGVCAYGFQQMLLRARALVPRMRPDIVIVQLSPWLAERARTPFAETFFGRLPTPYFADGPQGLVLHSPVFATELFSIPVSEFRRTDESTGDFAAFVVRVGLPLFLHDDLHGAAYRTRLALDLLAPGTSDMEAVTAQVFAEVDALCRQTGSRLCVLSIGPGPRTEEIAQLRHLGVPIVDGQGALYAQLEDKSPEGFRRAYSIWRGTPPVLVDPHPSPAAHTILAAATLRALGASPRQGH